MNESDATDLVTALFDRWYMSLVRYALRTTPNYAAAEDLAQETFMQLYQALRAGKLIEHPKAWTICVLRPGTCGGQASLQATSATTPVAYVYVASGSATRGVNHIVAYSAAANGKLTGVSGSPFGTNI